MTANQSKFQAAGDKLQENGTKRNKGDVPSEWLSSRQLNLAHEDWSAPGSLALASLNENATKQEQFDNTCEHVALTCEPVASQLESLQDSTTCGPVA